MAAKLDLTKKHAAEYVTPRMPTLVKVAPAQYLAIYGKGKPGGPEFEAAVGALFNVAFTIKMAAKYAGKDYAVCKLEGLWPSWETWTLLIRTPDFITAQHRTAALATLAKRKKGPLVAKVELVTITEGLCVQMLHVGPYSEEPKTVAQMHEFARSKGLTLHGEHHEIYLADPRRVKPEKLRTILRQPVR